MKLNNKKQQINSRWRRVTARISEEKDSVGLVLAVGIVIILTILGALAIKERPAPSCDKYANYSIDDLPVRCFDYFGIQTYRYLELKK